MSLQKTIDLATIVRGQVEAMASEIRCGGWSSRRNSGGHMDLCGACAYASRVLVRVLKAEGIDAVICVGEFDLVDHCWIELLPSEDVVDVTATQFKKTAPPVHLVPQGRATLGYHRESFGPPGSWADRKARQFDGGDSYIPPLAVTVRAVLRAYRNPERSP